MNERARIHLLQMRDAAQDALDFIKEYTEA